MIPASPHGVRKGAAETGTGCSQAGLAAGTPASSSEGQGRVREPRLRRAAWLKEAAWWSQIGGRKEAGPPSGPGWEGRKDVQSVLVDTIHSDPTQAYGLPPATLPPPHTHTGRKGALSGCLDRARWERPHPLPQEPPTQPLGPLPNPASGAGTSGTDSTKAGWDPWRRRSSRSPGAGPPCPSPSPGASVSTGTRSNQRSPLRGRCEVAEGSTLPCHLFPGTHNRHSHPACLEHMPGAGVITLRVPTRLTLRHTTRGGGSGRGGGTGLASHRGRARIRIQGVWLPGRPV